MKAIVFAYHDMGCTGLKALIEAGIEIQAVFTHPDAAGENHFHGSVALTAGEHNIPVFMPADVNLPSSVRQIQALAPELIFCFSYRQVFDEQILNSATIGAFNVHASLLPAYRGRAHLNWVLIKGENETGVTLHRMIASPDKGPILAQHKVAITAEDDALSLHSKLVSTAGVQLARWLPALLAGELAEREQDEARASRFGRRKPEDGQINWLDSAVNIHNLVRALAYPWPGAFTFANAQRIIVWQSCYLTGRSGDAPGTVISTNPLVIACGEGQLEIIAAQHSAGERLSGAEFSRQMALTPGLIFTLPC
ncbi:formyltransferase family protein [Erwinia sp.]|uniref:formyltransferase family protein n=1 Tax=Erwinia citreus TaxID=558 RepID=UPI003C789FC7